MKALIKDFFLNRIVPILPRKWLVTAYNRYLLPKAASDLAAIRYEWEEYLQNELMEIANTGYPSATGNQAVLCMVGLPHDGKTTAANVVAEVTGLVRINSNMVRNWLIDAGRGYGNIDAIVLSLMCDVLLLEGARYNVILDSDCMLPGKRAFIRAVARSLRYVNVIPFRVSTQPEIWRARLFFPEVEIGRMYADGLKGKSLPGISALRLCVKGEYDRQKVGHTKYENELKAEFTIHNDNGLETFQRHARTIALHFLARYGNAGTRGYASRMGGADEHDARKCIVL